MKKTLLALGAICMLFAFSLQVNAQSSCSSTLSHGSGFTTSIESVYYLGVNPSGDPMHTVTLRVENDGCTGPDCKSLNQYSIEALPGTYSDISHVVLVGNMTANGINMGPNLGGTPFQGFRIASINGIGNGEAGIFLVEYTLTGGLQNQRTQIKASSNQTIVEFSISDFEAVMNCGGLLPYYAPPDGGKIEQTDRIGAELLALYNVFSVTGTAESDDIYQIIFDDINNLYYVVVDVFPSSTSSYTGLLSTLQGSPYMLTAHVPDPDSEIVTGQILISSLGDLNNLIDVGFAAPVYPAKTNIGLVTSQGDTSMLSHIVRDLFQIQSTGENINGAGIRIGVLSNSYNTKPNNAANDDVLNRDLPGIGYPATGGSVPNPNNSSPVEVLHEYPYGEASDEGRAMMQILHDVAPGAELVFTTGVVSPQNFADGIIELATPAPGYEACDVIVDDITIITEPFFEDGVVANAVNSVVSGGVAYFTSAGNFGSKSHSGTFTPSSLTVPGISGTPHNFQTSPTEDVFQAATATEPGSYIIVLQWDDGSGPGNFYSTNTDLDIYIMNENGTGVIGFNRDNFGSTAVEVLPFIAPASAQTNIVIVNSSGTNAVNFKYVIFQGSLTIDEYNTTGTSTIVGHANSEGAMTVGAVRYDNTPIYGGTPTVMSYSSRGGQIGTVNRFKPDFIAPNGVNTSVDLGTGDWLTIDGGDPDNWPNFWGTSAAAPHAAAVAALLMQAQNEYYTGTSQSTTISPDAIRTVLSLTALDMYGGGYDVESGSGFIRADRALMELANPSPLVAGLIYDDLTYTPGIDYVPIQVTGEYFITNSSNPEDNTIIYFNGLPLETTVVNDTTLQAEVPPFTELYPEIQTFNTAKEGTNGDDGGLSNPLYFVNRPTIVGLIDNQTKAYGEDIPVLTVTYWVEYPGGQQLTLQQAGLSQAEIDRVLAIPIVSTADALSNAGSWIIEASLEDPLNPAYTGPPPAAGSIEEGLLSSFDFHFNTAVLTITKLDLTITPNDAQFIFGEDIGGFTYTFDDNPPISGTYRDQVLFEVQTAYESDISNAVFLSQATALVNASWSTQQQATALVNTSYMASATALVNGSYATALVNGTLFSGEELMNAIATGSATALVNVNVSGTSQQQATALVNGKLLASGSATALVNLAAGQQQATALVNAQNLANATALVNGSTTATALVNAQATALVNTNSFNAANNADAIVLLSQEDLNILSAIPSVPDPVELTSINLITGNTVGQHYIAPGTFIASNFNVTYDVGNLTILPADAIPAFGNLNFTYDGTAKAPIATTTPEGLLVDYNYFDINNVALSGAPTDAGTYSVVATVNDENYIGTVTGTMVIDAAAITITADAQTKVYGQDDPSLTFQITVGGLAEGDAFTGTLVRLAGNDVGQYEIQQGTVTAGNNYNLSYIADNLTITQAPLEITADAISKVYGETDPELTYLVTDGSLYYGDSFEGLLSREDNNNVGIYPIQQGTMTAGGNYDLSYLGADFTITLAFLEVTADDKSKTYGQADPELTYIVTDGSLSYSDVLEGTLFRAGDEDVGTWEIQQGTLTAGDNYLLSFISGELTISQADLTVSADNASKVYGESDPTFTYQAIGLVPGDNFTGALSRDPGQDVNTYNILQGDLSAGGNYNMTFVSGVFTITTATLTVISEHQIINEGETAPAFTFTFNNTFVNGDNALSVFPPSGVPTYTLAYNTGSGPGAYPITLDPVTNYVFDYGPDPIHLYVNPDGPGTKAVAPKLVCVEETHPGDPYPYTAYYEYNNKNNVDVYVLVGPDNIVTGNYMSPLIGQPIRFLSGGSIENWEVRFDGTQLKWEVASQHHGHKSSTGSNASSTSNKCHKSDEVALPFGSDEDTDIFAYPNPVKEKVYLELNQEVTASDIFVYDIYGKRSEVKVSRTADESYDLDFSGMTSGIYIIKINMGETIETIRIVKQ